MVNTRAKKAENVEFRTSGDATTVVIFGGSPVGTITERPDGEYDYVANDDRTMDAHFPTYEEMRDFVKVALGSDVSSNGPTEVPEIITTARKGRAVPKSAEAQRASAERKRESDRKKKDQEKERERKKKDREKLAAKKKADREKAAEEKKAEREKKAEERKAAREAAKEIKLDGLVPSKMRGKPKLATVAIADIDQIDVGEPVGRELVESVKVHGILQPPTLRLLENGRYVPVIGRRRLQAARANGMTTVDAIIEGRSDEIVNDNVTLLVENLDRSENTIAQFKAAQALIDSGFTPKQIAKAAATEVRQITKLLRIGRLHPRLIEATEDGLMAPWSADHAARKEMGEQEELVRRLDENGKITTDDIKGMGKVAQKKETGKLAEQFKLADVLTDESIEEVSRDTVGALPDGPESRRAFAAGHLRMAVAALVAAGDDGIAELVTSAIRSLETASEIA